MTNLENKDQMKYLEIKQTINTNDEKYLRAKERITEVKKFYSKLLSSVLLIAFLAAVNYFVNEWRYMWFLWAALGIGLGILTKAIKVFGAAPFLSRGWEKRKIQEFMDEEEQQNRWN